MAKDASKTDLRARAGRISATLAKLYPQARISLDFSNAWECLVATILSAQCTDERVNRVTPVLFKEIPGVAAMAAAPLEKIQELIASTGFFRQKAKALKGCAHEIMSRFKDEVPARMEDLVTLPGVGRKTANVVLGHALGVPGLPVDRHVLRVANRIGIAESDDPIVVEQQLCDAMPPERWTRTSDTLILHGRRICRPKPLCDQCFVVDDCDYFRLIVSRARDGKAPKVKGKNASRTPKAGSRLLKAESRPLKAGSQSRARKAGPRGTKRVRKAGR
jgi:endonuclease-3